MFFITFCSAFGLEERLNLVLTIFLREEYIEKLAKIRKERFTPVADFEKHFEESV